MKTTELRNKNLEELKRVEFELIKESFNLTMQKATGQLSKPHHIQKVRKDISRVYTIMSEKGRQK